MGARSLLDTRSMVRAWCRSIHKEGQWKRPGLMPWFLTPVWGAKLPICCAGLAGRVGQSDGRAAEPVCSNKCLLVSVFDWIGRQGVGDFQIWFLMACAGLAAVLLIPPCVSQTHAESLCGCVQTEASKSYYAWDLRSLGKKSTLWSFCAVCLDATLSSGTLSFMFWNFSSSSQPWPPSPSSWFIFTHHLLSRLDLPWYFLERNCDGRSFVQWRTAAASVAFLWFVFAGQRFVQLWDVL